ncbi:MAG: hypothetical protein LC753_13090 [Acidobacteria bacterium]|nr:hypothetical protein [Acidobacteriota bacterium]
MFVWTIVALGTLAIAAALAAVSHHPLLYEWLVLAAVTVVSGAATLRMPSTNVTITVSDVFVFSALILFGPAAATLTVAIDAFVMSLRLAAAGALRPPIFLFNVAAPALAVSIAGSILYGWIDPRDSKSFQLVTLMGGLAVSAGVYFVLGTGLIAALMAIQRREPVVWMWRHRMLGLWPTYATGAYGAGLVAVYAHDRDPSVLAYLLPLPFILYFAFRATIGRVEDQMRHLGDTNESYQRMIEALAHAVDAKDQVTHGHIRRVQLACHELAQALGVTAPEQLRALDAAALLHDLGKIAVPRRLLRCLDVGSTLSLGPSTPRRDGHRPGTEGHNVRSGRRRRVRAATRKGGAHRARFGRLGH